MCLDYYLSFYVYFLQCFQECIVGDYLLCLIEIETANTLKIKTNQASKVQVPNQIWNFYNESHKNFASIHSKYNTQTRIILKIMFLGIKSHLPHYLYMYIIIV